MKITELEPLINNLLLHSEEGEFTIFNGISSVTLPIYLQALQELLDYVNASEEAPELILTILYRVIPIFTINRNNIYRLLLTITLLALKMDSDESMTNKEFCKYIGLEKKDLARLEYHLLRMLDYKIAPAYVSVDIGNFNRDIPTNSSDDLLG